MVLAGSALVHDVRRTVSTRKTPAEAGREEVHRKTWGQGTQLVRWRAFLGHCLPHVFRYLGWGMGREVAPARSFVLEVLKDAAPLACALRLVNNFSHIPQAFFKLLLLCCSQCSCFCAVSLRVGSQFCIVLLACPKPSC